MKILYRPNNLSQQRQFEKKDVNVYPILLAMQAEWYRQRAKPEDFIDFDPAPEFCHKHYINSFDRIITEPEDIPFLELPSPDRIFTRAKKPIYQNNGNFKYHPGTYILSANGCWWGKCKFCVENGVKYEVRPVDDVLNEIKECKELGFREIFDDSGTFPRGAWLSKFVKGLKDIDVKFSCNFRAVDVDYEKLKRAGFRMMLFGVESANPYTLKKIKKGIEPENFKYIIKAALSGIEVHVAAMVGFPWETEGETIRTVELVKYLLKKGYAHTAQMSFYSPPKDQEQGNERFRKYVNKFYSVGFSPEFWVNRFKRLKTKEDFLYLRKELREGVSWIKRLLLL